MRYELNGNVCLTRIHGDAFAKQLHEIASGIDAKAQRIGARRQHWREARSESVWRDRGSWEYRRGKHILRATGAKGPEREGLPLKQHVGHGVAVEGQVEGFAQTRVGGGGLGVVEAKARSVAAAELQTRRLSWRALRTRSGGMSTISARPT